MLRLLSVCVDVSGQRVLDEVSLQVRAGELVVIEGSRGAGKSCLARVAAVARRPHAGEVWIADRDVTTLQRSSLPSERHQTGGELMQNVPEIEMNQCMLDRK